MIKLSFIFLYLTVLCGISNAALSATTTRGSGKAGEVRNFMNETIAIIKKFINTTTNLSADISIRHKVAGVTDFLNQDCHIDYNAPGYLKKEVKGMYPFTTIVSNNTVITKVGDAGETDIRPLLPSENIFETFLGIGYFRDIKKYKMKFRTEGSLYVLKGEMPTKYWIPLRKNIVENAHVTVYMEIWVDPRTQKIVKSQVRTLGGRDTTYTYRVQWVNGKLY